MIQELLAKLPIRKILSYAVAITLIILFLMLVIIPGIENSKFTKLQKYDTETRDAKALKRKQEASYGRYYQTEGYMESEEDKIYRIGDFTTNIRDDSKKKLILNISVQYSNGEVVGELKTKNPIIRNTVISVSSHAHNLYNERGKELLKEDLKEELNNVISDGEITDVYFNKFLIQ